MDAGALKLYLKGKGATLVGVGDVSNALPRELLHLDRGIAIAVNRNLNLTNLKFIASLQTSAEVWLKARGFRSLIVPPDSDRKKGKLISKLYPFVSHKTVATCAGLGWIGKNGLIINREYGSKLTWASVLTNAPFFPDEPVRESECGECELCVKHCPSGALWGRAWSLGDPLQELVLYEKCRSLKKERVALVEKPNCGLCVTICPYSRNRSRQEIAK